MRKRHLCLRSIRNQIGASEIAQFIPAMYVLFLLVLLPLLNLMNLFLGAATLYLATNDFAAKAATQPDFSSALNSMGNEAYHFQSLGLAKFLRMVPFGGYTGCGDDLYVLSTKIATGSVTSSPANKPLNQKIDTQNNMYEMSVKSVYSISPLISLSCIPVLGSVPGLGVPAVLTFTASRPVEHPGGLLTAKNNGNGGGKTSFLFRADSGSNMPPPNQITWRTPNIYQLIKNAGQTIIGEYVFPVDAGSGWAPSGINVSPGQVVWMDSSATGQWNTGPGTPNWDANGSPTPGSANDIPWLLTANAPFGSLIAEVGAPPPPIVQKSGPINSPNLWKVGDVLLNHPIVKGGPIYLTINDNGSVGAGADTGVQWVRAIITQ